MEESLARTRLRVSRFRARFGRVRFGNWARELAFCVHGFTTMVKGGRMRSPAASGKDGREFLLCNYGNATFLAVSKVV